MRTAYLLLPLLLLLSLPAQSQPRKPATPPAPAASAAISERFDIALVDAPAAQVFLQLGQGTRYQVLVAPEVDGRISLNLRQTTVIEALDTIKELYGYDYKLQGDKVFVYSNAVSTRIFKINYLPGRRQGESDTRVSSSAMAGNGAQNTGGSGGSGSGSGGGNNNAQGGMRTHDSAQVKTSSDADFWAEVRASLALLVGSSGGRSVVLNPSAGVVVVRAPGPELRQVEEYLKAIQVSIERQVMLEAKILEVSLSDDARTGINWGAFGQVLNGARGGSLSIGVGQPGAVISPTGPITDGANITLPGASINVDSLGRGFYGLAFQATNFAAMLNFLETQGDVHVLSSPRIATLNNQKALLKVGSDELYVTGITTNQQTNAGGQTTNSPTLTVTPFFSGIVLDVTPQIDAEGQVMLHVHPSISLVSEREKILNLGTLGNFRLPLASSAINETDAIVRVKDGQIVAIGGLMTQELRGDRSGLPGLSSLPLIGNLFGQKTRVNRKRELVILIKPTVIPASGEWPESLRQVETPAPPVPQRTVQ